MGRGVVFWLGAILGGVSLLFVAGTWIYGMIGPEEDGMPPKMASDPTAMDVDNHEPSPLTLKKLDWSSVNLSDRFSFRQDGISITVESTLDPELQQYIIDLLKRSGTEKAAVVALRPDDGRILAMVSYDKRGHHERLCLKADFPAASLFKIVAAAAAIERAGFTPDRTVYFDGYKYTLYKRQLKQRRGRYTSAISFKRAFGSSINPVFGKLGIYTLGQEVMADSAEKFLFNRSIPFDFPVDRSIVKVPEDDFGLAEIASGFNKKTVISPLHAALLASVVANDGRLMRPWLIKRVVREDGQILYRGGPKKITDPISRETAEDLKILMQETVLHGTCRRSFQRFRRKKAFNEVEFGAKTGTINDRTGQFKYDWLTAYAIPPDGDKGICVAVLGVHGEKLGIRAAKLGRIIINYYLSS